MSTTRAVSRAFYRHPAFLPHRFLKSAGIRRFGSANALLVLLTAACLTLCSAADHSLTLPNGGYGLLEHPGIFGWLLIQATLPVTIYRTVRKAMRTRGNYRRLSRVSGDLGFQKDLLEPLISFIAIETERSRVLYSTLFTFGFAAFAWTMFQNLWPGKLAPHDFWDSIHYTRGYTGACVYKFYMHTLLIPSVLHIFFGVVWFHASFLKGLVRRRCIRILPFATDRCGGIAFLSELILSPAITALGLSGLAFFGVVYTHRQVDASTLIGVLAQSAVLILFYAIPTVLLRGAITRLKSDEIAEIKERQRSYYAEICAGKLRGAALRDAHAYTTYFDDVVKKVEKIPRWPHLYRIFGTFGATLTPALVLSSLNLLTQAYKLIEGHPLPKP